MKDARCPPSRRPEGDKPVGRILVVDDEPRVVNLIGRALTQEGLMVDSARDGKQALELLDARPYDLVILDLMMPTVTGTKVLDRLREERPEQRVVVLSARDDTETKIRCLESGACDYVSKPFDTSELVARVQAHLRSGKPVPIERRLRVGDITLDLERRTVDAGAGAKPLSGREFDLLRYLMLRPGRPCTREELLEAVWSYSYDPGTNVVDVYVHRLRHKLARRDTIETLRDVGYCLNVA